MRRRKAAPHGPVFGGQRTTISFFILSDGSYYCFATAGQTQCLSAGGIGSPLDQNAAALANRDLVDHPTSGAARSGRRARSPARRPTATT